MKNCKVCAKCGCNDTKVYESRSMYVEDIDAVCYIRRRRCKNCGFKWKTVEVEYWELMKLLEGK